MGQTRSIFLGLALTLGQTVGASAADLGLPEMPMEVAPVVCTTCGGPWYLKGFIGAANPTVGSIETEAFAFNDFQVFHEDIKSSTLFGAGIGYDTGHYFRFDVTGEYRGKSLFIAQDRYPGGNGTFSVESNDADGTFLPGTNEYTADIESWLGLANMYIDLGTWYCVTPYIGGGVGVASVSVLGLKDVNVPNASVFYASDHTETNFAWAVYAGLAYEVTSAVTLDLSYRYADLGDARSGTATAFDGSGSFSGVDINDIDSHDLMLGVRWKLGKQAAAPIPVAFK